MLLSLHSGLGGLGVSDDSYGAFRAWMLEGRCLYTSFTERACSDAVAASKKLGDQVRINPLSFHAAGEPQTKAYSLYGNVDPNADINSAAISAMVNAAAQAAGLLSPPATPAPPPPPAASNPTTATPTTQTLELASPNPAAVDQQQTFPWGWVALGAGALAVCIWGLES